MNNDLSLFLSRYLFTPLMQDSSDNTPHSAAVLVPIINRPWRPTLLFTQRSYHLRHHPGQVAFPGENVMKPITRYMRPRCVKLMRRSVFLLTSSNWWVSYQR